MGENRWGPSLVPSDTPPPFVGEHLPNIDPLAGSPLELAKLDHGRTGVATWNSKWRSLQRAFGPQGKATEYSTQPALSVLMAQCGCLDSCSCSTMRRALLKDIARASPDRVMDDRSSVAVGDGAPVSSSTLPRRKLLSKRAKTVISAEKVDTAARYEVRCARGE